MPDQSLSLLSVTAWKQRLVFWCGAIFIGLLIVSMTRLSEWATVFFRSNHEQFPWFSLIVSPIGLTLTTWITFRFFSGSERSGIPQVKAALEITGDLTERFKLLSLRIAIGKIILSIMGLLSGASVGLGGPATHIGASLMASLGKAVRFPPHYMEKGLILAGSAAGFAAMFSAPLTGIVFAIEEMGRALEEKISSLVLTAIVFSGVTAFAILDSYIFFSDNIFILPPDKSWFSVPICGVCGGFLGALFSKFLIVGSSLIKRTGMSQITVAFFCGIVIAILGHLSDGNTFGTGYQQAQDILVFEEEMDPLFPLYKILATGATFFSGIPAGIFVPSIATGAGIGVNLAHWFPLAPTSIMVLLTITAYFSGMLQSPLTSFVLIMEMTYSNEILIPLMATAFIATGTGKLINKTPLYRALTENYKPTSNSPPTDEQT